MKQNLIIIIKTLTSLLSKKRSEIFHANVTYKYTLSANRRISYTAEISRHFTDHSKTDKKV